MAKSESGLFQNIARIAHGAGFASAIRLCALTILILLVPSQADSAEESDTRRFAAHALALRSAIVAGEERGLNVLSTMPGAGMLTREMLSSLWSPSFANAIVKLGRLRSTAPVALYYDPLLDLAVVTRWRQEDEGYRVVSVRALPGERLAVADAAVTIEPSWLSAEVGAVGALSATTAARLDAFRRAHPPAAADPGPDPITFAAAAADLRAVMPRLAWHVAQRAQWSDAARPWLQPALTEVEQALAARDPSVLIAAAPDTDEQTAVALADLPAGFAAGLRLDMALESGGHDRLLIGSLAEDGDIYVLALCGMDTDTCALRRLMLVSLLD